MASQVRDAPEMQLENREISDEYPRDTENPKNPKNPQNPEKKIILFAVKLAILEKLASGLGYLAFVWATVVLLGGFASSLERADFWVVTAILLMEGTRILSRGEELRWHHEVMLKSLATLIGEVKQLSNKLFRWTGSNNRNEDPWVETDDSLNEGWISKISLIFLLLQLSSALAYIGLSIYRLVKLDRSGDSNRQFTNMEPTLKIFYSLSLGEAFLILLEKAYWLWKIYVTGFLKEVNIEYGFPERQPHIFLRFFYDTYSRCVNRGIFEGLNMEFVKHNIELLQSGNGSGQLAGARVLYMLAIHKVYRVNTLRAIGTMRDVVERLIDILNFRNDKEREIRKVAAQIICELVENNPDTENQDNINRDCIRVTAIDGFMESIASLLYSKDVNPDGLVFLGLTILQNLAYERSNHDKIASSRGLLPKIFALVDVEPLEIQKLSLQIVKTLASTTGSRGKALRKQIREIVFSISNLRNVLEYQEESKLSPQILAIKTLRSLASEKEGRETIGGTGGVLNQLFSLFIKYRNILSKLEADNISEKKKLVEKLVKKAIGALRFLSFKSEHNCEIMMSIKLDDHRTLIATLISVLHETTAMNDKVQFNHVARILRNLLVHAKAADVNPSEISALAQEVMLVVKRFPCQPPRRDQGHSRQPQLRYRQHSCFPLEAAIGLAAQFFSFMIKRDPVVTLEESNYFSQVISELVEVLKSHTEPMRRVPNIRRYSLELLKDVMLNADRFSIDISPVMQRRSEVVGVLNDVMKTTSDWERYNAFSGSMGLSRHDTSIRDLAKHTMESFINHP